MDNCPKVNLKKIRELRIARNWTQAHVAELLGVCRKTYSNIENGYSLINANHLLKFAEDFKVYLLALAEIPINSIQYQFLPNNVEALAQPNNITHYHNYYCNKATNYKIEQLAQELQTANEKLQEKDELIERLRNKNAQLKKRLEEG